MFEKEKVLEVRFAKQKCEKVFGVGILALAEQYGDRRATRTRARVCARDALTAQHALATQTHKHVHTHLHAAPRRAT